MSYGDRILTRGAPIVTETARLYADSAGRLRAAVDWLRGLGVDLAPTRFGLACVSSWLEDFRGDLADIDVPTLVIQGDADHMLPIQAAGLRTSKLIKGARMLVLKDDPHCIPWTHSEEVNAEILGFLAGRDGTSKMQAA